MSERLCFGDFELRPAERLLLRSGQPVHLGGRAFELLLALVHHHDRLLTKDDLLRMAWRGRIVEEANVQVQVSVLRKVIGHHAISTLAGCGYRFTAELRDGP